MYKRIIAFFISVVIVAGCYMIPASASLAEVASTAVTTVCGWMADALGNALPGFAEGVIAAKNDACASSPNGHHSFKQVPRSDNRHFVVSKCAYCGVALDTYLSGSYRSYANGIQSDLGSYSIGYDTDHWYVLLTYTPQKWGASYPSYYSCTLSGQHFSLSAKNAHRFVYIVFDIPPVPFAGQLKVDTSEIVGDSFSILGLPTYYASVSPGVSYSSEVSLRFDGSDAPYSVSGVLHARLIPTGGAVADITTQDITINSRPTSIYAPIGYYDSSNNLQVVKNTTIVNETNNTFYNPVTNTTSNVTNWAYDYSDRSYHLTLDTGANITVTYGDENITINQGDTVTNIYYVIPGDDGGGGGGSGGTGGDPNCKHNYTSAITTAAGCTTKGVMTFTCDKCSRCYTEYIDALGHDWQVTETVATAYALPEGAHCPTCSGTEFTSTLNNSHDQYACTCSKASCGAAWTEAPVVTYGHTTSTCARCGATKTDTEDPDSGLFTALGNFLSDGIIWITDKLVQLIDSMSGINKIFTQYVENLKASVGEYPAFLGAVIAILPEDLMNVIWFGVIAGIALAVWKKWFS